MKHINLSSWKDSISDWTELNYVKGGLADEYADIANVKGNYVKKSNNLCPTATYDGVMNNTIAKTIDLGNLPQGTYSISLNVSANANNRTIVIYFYNNSRNVGNSITSITGTGAKTYTFTLDDSIPYDDIRLGINTQSNDYSITLNNLMLNTGDTALPYNPWSTSGLYIEDNVNDELIPINDPDVLNRMKLNLSKRISEILEDEIPINDEDVK